MRRRSRLKTWGLKVTLVGGCLLAGAVVTWAVAWGCALWGTVAAWESQAAGFRSRWAPLLPEDAAETLWMLSAGPTRTGTYFRAFGQSLSREDPLREAWIQEYGWPMRAMFGRDVFVPGSADERPRTRRMLAYTFIPAPHWLRPRQFCMGLPAEVLPLGFALNTLLAAGVVLVLVEAPGAARRRRRRRKGRCPSCGYDRAGLAQGAACPECGGNA